MQTLTGLIESGRIVDLMLVFVALEVVVLVGFHARTGRGIPPLPLVLNLGAGASLMFALRAVLMESGWQWVAGFLVLSLLFHVGDQARRWRP